MGYECFVVYLGKVRHTFDTVLLQDNYNRDGSNAMTLSELSISLFLGGNLSREQGCCHPDEVRSKSGGLTT